MDLPSSLQSILERVRLAEREMMLLPEVFHATAELHLAAGDLAGLIAEASATPRGFLAARPQLPTRPRANAKPGMRVSAR